MATNDPNKARARFLNALRRITNGLEVQRARILERAAEAPRTVLGPHEIVDLRGEQGNDLDYYAYELGRLQDLTNTVNKTFDDPEEIVNALTAFEKTVPNLRKSRNP